VGCDCDAERDRDGAVSGGSEQSVTADLEFEASTHTYRVAGQVIPGVTTILKDAGLIDYSMIPQEVLLVASQRGTAVHQALQYLDDGTLDESSVDLSIAGYIEAYKRFCDESGFVPGHIEHRVFHPAYRYAGTLDRTGVFRGSSAPVLLDFKTGIVLPGHRLQLAAYTHCMPAPRRFRRCALKLNADATYRLHEFPASEYQRDVEVFLSALACVQWRLQQSA
jgi:hypothetical protein